MRLRETEKKIEKANNRAAQAEDKGPKRWNATLISPKLKWTHYGITKHNEIQQLKRIIERHREATTRQEEKVQEFEEYIQE